MINKRNKKKGAGKRLLMMTPRRKSKKSETISKILIRFC